MDHFGDVEDQRHLTVAQDRRPGDPLDLDEIRFEALDDYLLLSQHVIDQQGRETVVVLDDDEQPFGRLGDAGPHAEQPMQANQRPRPAAAP